MEFKQECKYFISDRPCKFHKLDSRIICEKCDKYQKKRSFSSKIIIIKLAALGDVVRTTSILKPLFKKYKNPQIYWITYKEALPVLDNNPYIKEKISYDTAWQLISEKFNVLINLDLAKEALRLTKLISAEDKVGFYLNEEDRIICSNRWAKRWFELSHDDNLKKKNKKTYQEYILRIIGIKNYKVNESPIIINLTEEEKKFAQKFAIQNNIKKNDLVVGINTGGGEKWPKKEWPIENTVELIKMLIEKMKKISKIRRTKILIFGGKKEKQRNQKIINNLTTDEHGLNQTKINKTILNSQFLPLNCIIDTGTDNTLHEFFSLLSLCDILVTTDSLALHIALGLDKKVIVLFGPTSASEIELYGLGKKIVSKKDCISCYNKNCQKAPDCMQLIKPETVFDAIKSLV